MTPTQAAAILRRRAESVERQLSGEQADRRPMTSASARALYEGELEALSMAIEALEKDND